MFFSIFVSDFEFCSGLFIQKNVFKKFTETATFTSQFLPKNVSQEKLSNSIWKNKNIRIKIIEVFSGGAEVLSFRFWVRKKRRLSMCGRGQESEGLSVFL